MLTGDSIVKRGNTIGSTSTSDLPTALLGLVLVGRSDVLVLPMVFPLLTMESPVSIMIGST
jgi:hypothetical protein